MPTDAAFLDELSAFLDTNDLSVSTGGSEHDQRVVAGTFDKTCASPLGTRPHCLIDTCKTNANDMQALKRLTRRQKEALRKQRYIRRQKNERETLNRMEKELTYRLTQLQQENEVKKRRTLHTETVGNSTWRDLALLQREQLHRSKDEQKKLVSAVTMQATYLNTLSKLVSEHLLRSVATKAGASMAIASSLQTNKQTNRFRFTEQLRQVVAEYAQVDDIFSKFDVFSMPNGMTSSMRGESGEEYFQHFNRFTQPFRLTQTQQTWWKLASFEGMIADREDYADLADPNQAAILRLRLVRTLVTGTTVSIIQRYIIRRVVEETRTIFTWKTLSEGEGIFAGMYLEETGWACLQDSIEDESTVVGVCVHQTPMRFGASSPQQSNSHEFCELMHNMLNENAQMVTAMLSKMLIDETLADIDI